MRTRFNSTTRFSDRVDYYTRYRPGYPDEMVAWLSAEKIIDEHTVIADIGSGTGISSEIFLKKGLTVFGVEPNDEMREAAERMLSAYTAFTSIKGRAEETKLNASSVNLIVAGQSFHWFDVERSKAEFRRILKPRGTCALIWNDRKIKGVPFLEEYDQLLLLHSVDYKEVNHKNISNELLDHFFDKGWKLKVFANRQVFDFDGLRGRVLSSSYAPAPGHAQYIPMLLALRQLYDKHQQFNTVTIEYDTKLYYGSLN